MNAIMFYDTETNGLPLWNQPSEDPGQPHIVQAAAILVDEDTRQEIASFDLISTPTDWEIPADVSDIHGITTERARGVGVPENYIVDLFWMFDLMSSRRIAHNESFDARIVRIGLKRFCIGDEADIWKSSAAECTSRMSTPIVNLPPTEKMLAVGRTHAKTAQLGEAYEFFFGKPLENAHSAIVDVRACAEIYWAIKDGNLA